MSGTHLTIQELDQQCKINKAVESTEILHKTAAHACGQQDSIADISTIEYLNQFRCELGYKGSAEAPQHPGQSVFGYKPVVDTNEGEGTFAEHPTNELGKDEECNCTNETVTTTDETKDDYFDVNLTKVRLSGHEITSASLLAKKYPNVTSVDVSDNCIRHIRKLGAMPYLQSINASRNTIDTFLEITPVPVALKEIDFSYNLVSSIVNLKKFWSLTDINLSHNRLTVIEGFSDLEYLQVLNLSYNKIDTILNLNCPNLLILYLNHNRLESVSSSLNCVNLRYINLNGNKISTLQGLRYMNELTELQIADNNIQDMSELENLKTILTLTRIRIDSNPISSLENWRLVLIHMLPQILWMDGQSLKAEELRTAENIFNPSYKKIAFVDHAALLLDRACQAANHVFDEHCRTRPFPLILLLVGSPKSQCHQMALLLKERFRSKVYLGGVHSTNTTLEGSCPHSDIPVSYDGFKEMKNRGEFLATSQILGRVCGFATSQIARAAETGALLVAAVPLTAAISIREWNLQPKLVLVIPSSQPEFLEDEERRETIRRSSLKDSELTEGSRKSKEREGEAPEEDDQNQNNTRKRTEEDSGKDHLVNFAEMLSVVPSLSKDGTEKIVYHEPQEPVFLSQPQHSILKTPHFGMEVYEKRSLLDSSSGDSQTDLETAKFIKSAAKVKVTPHEEHEKTAKEIDLEKKRKSRKFRSLGPGMERYSSSDDDDDDDVNVVTFDKLEAVGDDDDKENESKAPDIDTNDNDGTEIMEIHDNELIKSSGMENIKIAGSSQQQPVKAPEESAPRNVTSRPRRLNRLASLLMLETDQRLDSSLNIADILMNLPTMEKVDPKLLQTVDLSTAQYPPDNTPAQEDNEENTLVPTEQSESTLIPPSFPIPQDPSSFKPAPVGNHEGLEEDYDLIVAKELAKQSKELEAEMQGEIGVKLDNVGITDPLSSDKKSEEIKPITDEEEIKSDLEEETENEEEYPDEIQAKLDAENEMAKKTRKCKKKCKSRRNSRNKESGCCGKGHQNKKGTLTEPYNTLDLKERKIDEPEEDRTLNFNGDIKREEVYGREFPELIPQKSIPGLDQESAGQNPPLRKDLAIASIVGNVNGQGVAEVSKGESLTNANPKVPAVAQEPRSQPGQVDLPPPSNVTRKKKGLRFEGSESEEQNEKSGKVEEKVETAVDGKSEEDSSPDIPIDTEEPKVEGKKVMHVAVKMGQLSEHNITTDEHEDHHLRHKDAMKSSIMQTREEYAEFNWDNPGFFHTVLDTSDLCSSFKALEDLAVELLLKSKRDSEVKDFLKASAKSHAGGNLVDEKRFLDERLKHFKSCASAWSKGYDTFNASADRSIDNDKVAKPSEVYFEKTHCPKGILDPSLPRSGITLKMKRIVELHEKKIRCSKKNC